LLELTWNGRNPLSLANDTTRSFLQDGDEVVITEYCRGRGYRVGFGEVRGRILSANRSFGTVDALDLG
jgi:fumarylacetoacetase